MRTGRPLMAAVALLTLATSIGCSGHPDSAATTDPGTSAVPATDRSTPATVTTTKAPSNVPGTTSGTTPGFTTDQQAVADAYNSANQAYEHAATASDPSDPTFKASFASTFLHELQIRIQQRKDNGEAVRDAQPSIARTSIVSVSVTPPTATVITCEVDDRVVYRVADGTAVNSKVTTARWNVAMTNEGGAWKVAGRQQTQTWDGEEIDTCLAAPQS